MAIVWGVSMMIEIETGPFPIFFNPTPCTHSTESKYVSMFMCAVVVLSCFAYLLGTMDRFKCVHE